MKNLSVFDLFRNLLDEFVAVLPKFIGAVMVFLIGLLIAKIVATVIRRLLVRINIDKWADKLNEIELIARSKIHFVPSRFISKLLYYILLALFLIAATDILGVPAVSQLMTDIINYIPYLISAMLVLIIGLFIADFIKNIVQTTAESLGIPSANLISSVIFWFLFLTVLMSALAQAKINTSFITSSFTVIIGGVALAFALGYGLASKDTMANYLASYTIKQKYKRGDRIKIGDLSGEVIALNNHMLSLKNEEGITDIPFSQITREKVTRLME